MFQLSKNVDDLRTGSGQPNVKEELEGKTTPGYVLAPLPSARSRTHLFVQFAHTHITISSAAVSSESSHETPSLSKTGSGQTKRTFRVSEKRASVFRTDLVLALLAQRVLQHIPSKQEEQRIPTQEIHRIKSSPMSRSVQYDVCP
jgi:hypothetical protein